ncbi:hypothetical protein D3C76_1502890 [compost metagenome]
MYIPRCHMHVRNQIVLHIHRAVVQIEEAFGLAITDHIAAVRVCFAHFNFLFFVHFLSGF